MAQSFDGILCCLNNNNKQAICRARQEVLLRLKRLKRGRMNNLTAVGSAGAGMKTDGTGGKTPQPFTFPYFITENKNGSGIGGNGIYELRKRAETGKFSGMHYCLITIHLASI